MKQNIKNPINSPTNSPLNSLGFAKPPAETRVVVAMSGGVDSSVTAALLVEEGYDVIGITLQLYDHGMAVGKKGACCAGQDIYDAQQVAAKLGIPHYVLDYESKFSQAVIDDFADSYLRGETPIPCVKCNQTVKFKDLLQTAKELGAEAMATGHYVRRVMTDQGAELHRPVDEGKDQTYFLFGTTKDQLDFLRFPLGGMTKEETRNHAARFALPVAEKPDSQDICFVPTGSYASLVEKLRPGAIDEGEIVHLDGRVLGTHKGIIHYTIGQRKGLGIGGIDAKAGEDTDPLYVIRLDPETKQVIVGPRSALAVHEIHAGEVNWLGHFALPKSGARLTMKFRSLHQPVSGMVYPMDDYMGTGVVSIITDEPQMGIAPGQAAVFYDGARCLGGGWILRSEDVKKRENAQQEKSDQAIPAHWIGHPVEEAA